MKLQFAPTALFLTLSTTLIAGCGDLVSPISEINDCNRIATIDSGETINSALTENDCTLIEDIPIDYRAFETDGETVTITLAPVPGDPFAPVLFLYDEDGEGVAETTGDMGETVTLTQELTAGAYAIGISSTSGFGSYEVTLQ